MPTRTKTDAIEDTAKDLKNTIEGGILQSNMDRETADKLMLMDISKTHANAYKNKDAERERVKKQST